MCEWSNQAIQTSQKIGIDLNLNFFFYGGGGAHSAFDKLK